VHPFRLHKIFERTFRPDVIYLASPATMGLQVWWQLRKSNIPIVANFQTDLSSYALRMLPPGLNQAASWAIDQVQGMCLRESCFKTILAPSTSSNNYLKSLKISPDKLQLVGRGVDGVLFNPAKRTESLRTRFAPNGEILLLCVSRLSLEKGFDFLAKAYEEMKTQAAERGITRKFRLVITGGNSNQSIEHIIKGYFEKHALDVVFTGPLIGESLAQMYASADIFVYPSLTETFGQVIQEAMASALPVIARREGGPADIVQPDVTGYLPEPKDVADFVDKTLLLIQDGEKRRQISEAAYAFAHTRSWDAINQQISQILTHVITKNEE
jgi:glycosyltransferase involved in cell wall biosynthesis